VIEDEIVKNIVERGQEALQLIDKGFETILILTGSRDEYEVPSEADLERHAKDRFEELSDFLKRVPFTIEHAKAALQRVNAGLPPNNPKNQQFKDSAIWEAVLELAHSYTVHFVSEDRGFSENRDLTKGLARNLQADCDAIGARVYLHTDLSSCLNSLKKEMPPLNKEDLTTRIAREVNNDLRMFAADKEFELGQLKNYAISGFATEKLNVLALSFELIYEAYDLSQIEYITGTPDSLTAKGNCTFADVTKALSDVRLESLE
jgi:hypothetical protein